jgi:hypothetical protein
MQTILTTGATMLEISIGVTNPFVTRNGFRNLFNLHGSFTTHKHWEIEGIFNKDIILGFELGTHLWGSDHAGPSLRIGILCFELNINIYDSRHWSYKTNTWTEYDYE